MSVSLPFWRDRRGTTALEFGLTAPAFFLFLFGVIEFGLLLWTQIGLQHGVEMAARCASVNSVLCTGSDAITRYASQQALGLGLPSSTFSYSSTACGNQVNASYAFQLPAIFGLSPLTVTAQACFPS
ncbi:TadE/TadG family type IV pilus assembly protein [Bradyrhizobium liaoningense]|uniref:TadE/TadG family type IV pilus assembly protein n=1 Tax=Bradyrhizobium liaoningense TaxID=43992 RepID=UPI001BA63201|nr:TadE/TadG family type IV pilus assembly protein [Bradyrhizobium liaoningense]MBR0712821.1 pilus assembly protein [Bradyrhizobium liaoningense]